MDRKKQIENSLQKIRLENDQLVREFNTMKLDREHQKQNILEKTRVEMLRLEE